jgi:hypothetical protein
LNKKLQSKRQDDDSDNEEEEEDEDGDAPKKGRRKSVLKTKKKKKAKRPSETDDEDPEDDEVKGGTSGVNKFASKFQIGNLSFSKVRGEGQTDAGIFKAGYCPFLTSSRSTRNSRTQPSPQPALLFAALLHCGG